MNAKASKTLSKYASVTKSSLKEIKDKFYATPRPDRALVLKNMTSFIELYFDRKRSEIKNGG